MSEDIEAVQKFEHPLFTRGRACPRIGSARVPIGRFVAYVYSSTRVARGVVYACYVCAMAHVSSVR